MPWIDEYRKSGLSTTTTFDYDITKGIYSTNTLGFQFYYLLTYREEDKISVRSDKNYLFKHTIYKDLTDNGPLRVNHFLEDDNVVYINSPDPKITQDYSINTDGVSGSLVFNTYYDSLYDKQVNNICTYWFNEDNSITSKHYIKNVKVEEIDFFINGYNIRSSNSNGWSYNNGQYTYTSVNTTDPIYKNNMDDIPFIGMKIPYNTFDIEFNYSKSTTLTGNVEIYLIETTEFEKWRTVSGTFSFDNINKIETISSDITSSSLTKNNLNGTDKYLVIKVPVSNISFSMSNIKITGGYSNLNNSLTNSNSTIFNTIKYINNYQQPYMGNGRFESGIWEDGVWNNGVRDDNTQYEFNDIINSYPVNEGKWRIHIGRNSLFSNSEIDDLTNNYVSIGNIVAIDINENRKLLKSSYLVIDVVDNYIIVESEFSFPIRRIEKDSNKHRIKVSKNIWLSGVFLNGVFNGIWNNGLVKGNPFNTKIENTQWIDGVFDGGRFVSEYNINGTFTSTSPDEIDNITYTKITVNGFDVTPLVGDEVSITNSLTEYNGNSTILKVTNNNEITINKQFTTSSTGVSNITLLLSTGLIQNFTFNDNNISKKVSSISSTNFRYNSWIDVNYNENQVVNIGSDVKVYGTYSQTNNPINNLYGYVTYDILSSTSKFRDSNSLNSRNYKLGTKYKIYSDFLGRSSSFDEPFNTSSNTIDSSNFYRNGWTFSTNDTSSSSIGFENTEPSLNNTGKELIIKTKGRGGVLNNTKINIERNRYSVVEFDLVRNDSMDIFGVDSVVNYGSGSINYPFLNFSNINYIENSIYLPIHKNVNVLSNPNKKKVEYFFNKEKLNMNILGYGENTYQSTERRVTIDNLKFYEVDMIPFFKYFNENNIYRGIQTPLAGTSSFIDFTLNRYPFIENNYIPFDSIKIEPIS